MIELSEQGQKDAEEIYKSFAKRIKSLCDEALGELEVNCLPHLETDAWTNYREELRIELAHEYKYSKFKDDWAKDLRRAILIENKEELVSLLNKDLVVRCKRLEDRVKDYEQFRYL